MSSYQFFASDKELSEYDNGIISLGRKKLQNKMAKDSSITEADELLTMRICIEDDLSNMHRYTNKKNGAYIEWFYSEKNATVMVAYIKEHLRTATQIELWNTWLEEKKEPQIRKCFIHNLSTQNIAEIFNKDCYTGPECLVIYK